MTGNVDHLIRDLSRLQVQHQGLVELVNAARQVVAVRSEDPHEIARILDEMVRHSKEHFELEESVMRRVGFPGLAAHRQLHQQFKQKTAELSLEGLAHDPELPFELLSYLAEWWNQHTLAADTEHELFLTQHLQRLGAVAGGRPAEISPSL